MLTPSSFTVMCIDDNVMLVDALERRLTMEPHCLAFHRVESFADAVDVAVRVQPTVVLLDIDLPGGVDAVALLLEFVRRTPESRVIVFTGYPDDELVTHTMELGAWGFVSKGVPADRLMASIRRVVDGEAVIEVEA